MAWNGSSANPSDSNGKVSKANGRTSTQQIKGRSSSRIKGYIAGLVIISGGVIAILTMSADDLEKPLEVKQSKSSQIGEVTAEIVTNSISNVEKEVNSRKRYWENPTTNGLSEAQIWKWHAVRRPKPHFTNDTARTDAPPRYKIFDHYSENEIALYLTIDPKSSLIGTPRYDKKFTDDFLKSCETPIVVTAEDDDYNRDLKQQMIATKIELMDRIRAGENLGEILMETRKEIQRLGQVRRQLESEVRAAALRGDATTDEELDDYVKAANEMLEKQGAAPIKMGPVIRRALVRRASMQRTK